MRLRVAGWALALAVAAATPLLAAQNFTFECPAEPYASVPTGTVHEFHVPIAAVSPGADSVMVDFDPQLPGTWFAQFCQVSTGSCFIDDAVLVLTPGVDDTLRVDFFPDPTDPGMGWANMTIRSVADPLDLERCTFTLYSGLPVPQAGFTLDCSDNTHFLTQGELTEFYTPIQNTGPTGSDFLVHPVIDVPGDWFVQYCQTSTGTCYFEDATIHLSAGQTDTLRVDFYTFDVEGSGSADLRVQSAQNPSLTRYCRYSVFLGDFPASASSPAETRGIKVSPNPFRESTVLTLRSVPGGRGDLAIFAADGRLVRSFPGLELSAGARQLRWDGRDSRGLAVSSGIYFYRLQTSAGVVGGAIVRTR